MRAATSYLINQIRVGKTVHFNFFKSNVDGDENTFTDNLYQSIVLVEIKDIYDKVLKL